ncbi:hypothetical protein GCM10022251_19790 [Phytohabitans flavus]|uniref:Uncharacterized protein n=1 Tax=Phytohabitans flavus TaxID=1076124 RepID=A0A6F8XZ77_9ACTN|nr:hypothetical protein [Phytohabitans flavus]BCB79154.1 hypothetical protein Pflav_055640 [Phytohabitans flavus]
MNTVPTPAGGESRPALPALPACGKPAVAHFELYDSPAYKSLDGSVYLCTGHAPTTVAAYEVFVAATGLTPFRMARSDEASKRCGDGFDFLAMQALTAPRPGGCHDCGADLEMKRCKFPYWFCPACGDPGHGDWVPEHDCVTDADITDAALRVLFPKGRHPVIDAAETAVRAAAEMHGPTMTRQGVKAVLETLPDLAALTDRERAGLLARFGVESVCATCHGGIEFVAKPATGGPAWGSPYYRHLAANTGSHIARPAVTR